MAAGIAHEINNPAAVILGNLEIIEVELGEHGRPATREFELIKQQVERIRHIVTSLLQFARAGPAEGAVSDVNVNSAIEDVLPLVGHVLRRKSVQLRKRLSATAAVAINVYDLEQVLINLIVNAANAVVERGTIEVETRDWELEGVMIGVHDDGAGIRPEHLLRIFDPFFTTDPHQGVGLGLSVSYGLVRRYGGDITVESTAGKGSVFRVWLRRRPEGVEAAA
jgi:two-component system NtrC family sensor kinase